MLCGKKLVIWRVIRGDFIHIEIHVGVNFTRASTSLPVPPSLYALSYCLQVVKYFRIRHSVTWFNPSGTIFLNLVIVPSAYARVCFFDWHHTRLIGFSSQ